MPSSPRATTSARPRTGGESPTATIPLERHLSAVPGCGTLAADSPDPFAPRGKPITAEAAVEALARSVLEVMAGARDIEQLSRWVTAEVFATLRNRVRLSTRARNAHGVRPQRPILRFGPVRIAEPVHGIVEGVVIVHGRGRSRAVAVRLETVRGRWQASALHIL
jgi:hypothetical protein